MTTAITQNITFNVQNVHYTLSMTTKTSKSSGQLCHWLLKKFVPYLLQWIFLVLNC